MRPTMSSSELPALEHPTWPEMQSLAAQFDRRDSIVIGEGPEGIRCAITPFPCLVPVPFLCYVYEYEDDVVT